MTIDIYHPYYDQTGTAQYVNNREAGFGTDPATRARFALAAWPEWTREVHRSTRAIKGTDREKSQTVYTAPLWVEYEIITTRENYQRLTKLHNATSNLILPLGATVHADEEYDVAEPREDMEVYLLMRSVKLMDIWNAQHYNGGRTRCWVRFKKRTGVISG